MIGSTRKTVKRAGQSHMFARRGFLISGAALAVAGCGGPGFRRYDGPEVTRIVVMKQDRRMYLLHQNEILKDYRIDLGFAPQGHKQFEGDGKTPEGRYFIDRRNPNSDFHLSLGISYPNEADTAAARALGKEPGGDIFIHGQARRRLRRRPDWTAGCISVKNRHIEDIYVMVRDGTAIDIFP